MTLASRRLAAALTTTSAPAFPSTGKDALFVCGVVGQLFLAILAIVLAAPLTIVLRFPCVALPGTIPDQTRIPVTPFLARYLSFRDAASHTELRLAPLPLSP